MKKFSVIIVSYNNPEVLKNCLESLYRIVRNEIEIIVVDNNSDAQTVEYLEKQDRIILIKNDYNAGFGKANNQGAKIASGKWLVLLNNDTVVNERFFDKAEEFFRNNPGYQLMGPLVLSPDGFPQPTFYNKDYYRRLLFPSYKFRKFVSTLSFKGNAAEKKEILYRNSAEYSFVSTHEVDSLSGVCIFMDRKVYDNIGMFDENYFMYVEDLDFCLKAKRNGYKIAFYPEVIITHFIKHISHKPSVSWFQYNNHLKYFFKKNYPWYISLAAAIVLSLKAQLKIIINKIRK